MYWATSDDGNVWTLERDPWRIPAQLDASTSMALDNSAIHYYPAPSDMDLTSSLGGCKGVTFTNLIDGNDNYLYCFLELWTTDPVLLIKQVAVRVKTDLSQRAGHNFNFEIYDTPYQTWRPVREGRLPRWIETDGWRGAVFASGLSRVCAWPHGFIALSAPGGAMTAQLTPSLPAGWTAAVPVSGSPSGVLQPQPVYTADGLHAVWAAKDSACSASAPYYGLQIWQGDLALT